MKNLPDDVFFDKLKARLDQFEEQPHDDVWDAVSAAISTSEPRWIKVAERSGLVLVLLLMIGSRFTSTSHMGTAQTEQPGNSTSVVHAKSEGFRTPSNNPTTNTGTTACPSAPSVYVPLSSVPPATRTQIFNSTRSVPSVSDANGTLAGASTRLHGNTPLAIHTDSSLPTAPEEFITYKSMPGDSTRMLVVPPLVSVDPATAVEPTSVFNPKQHRTAGWRLYVLATPSLTFHQVSASTSDDITFQRLNSPGVLSTQRLSFTFEAGAQLYLSKRLMAFAGFTWYQQSLDVSLEQQMDGIRPSTPQGSLDFDFDPNTKTTTINCNMQNIGITAGLGYTVSIGKLAHQFGGSLQYEYGLARTGIESDTQNANHYVNYRLFYRVEYNVSNRLSVFIQPSFARTLLQNELLQGAIKVRQTRAGIGVGVLLKF